MRDPLALLTGPLLVCLLQAPLQAASLSTELLAGWVALEAPTGHEQAITGYFANTLSGWRHDRAGNLIKTVGESGPHTLVACLLDAPSFTVSAITADGYLRLHAVGELPKHPLWTQAHEGQQLRVLTAEGPVVGVTALANGHFMNLHRDETRLTQPQDLWVDVGARSDTEVAALGIALLDPVIRNLPPWHFEDWVAGPSAGARAGCATAVAAAEAGVTAPGQRTSYALTTRGSFSGMGVSAALSALGDVDRLILLDRGLQADRPETPEPTLPPQRLLAMNLPQTTVLRPQVRAPGSLMERLQIADAEALAGALFSALGVDDRALAWTAAPARAMPRNALLVSRSNREREMQQFAARLGQLGELPAVSEHEGPVARLVRESLPAWAAAKLQSDDVGNLWLDLGPRGAMATVFMAHMDEVGWEVSAIAEDGVVALRRRGGALSLAREGQPALLQLDAGRSADSDPAPVQLRGVFLSREEPQERWPEALHAWFGMDGDDLTARGVRIGMPVTGHKEAHRLGATRFTVRGMDDRVGTAALLGAVERLNPEKLQHRVIFAWSVQEETGLVGARELARRFAAETARIYSVDTFVSADTPLEAPHFAYAPLGQGPVLRSMESRGMASRAELSRNRRIAADAGIAVQVGMTQGGTDGTTFTFFGVPNAGLSWPGRYSHGPAELGDLGDMLDLVDLIVAFARTAPEKR